MKTLFSNRTDGYIEVAEVKECGYCKGSGRMTVFVGLNDNGEDYSEVPCAACDGSGISPC